MFFTKEIADFRVHNNKICRQNFNLNCYFHFDVPNIFFKIKFYSENTKKTKNTKNIFEYSLLLNSQCMMPI